MPLELHPLTESDIPAYDNIVWKAFIPGIMALKYPNGYSQAARDHSNQHSLKEWREYPDTVKMMKVVDTDLPDSDSDCKMIGAARWVIHPRPRTEEQLEAEEKEGREDGLPPGADAAMLEDFMGAIHSKRKEFIGGEPYVLLHILATLPLHHRRGVGQMHLKWGIEEADKLGLPIYLESSVKGKGLYEKTGFQSLGLLPLDWSKYSEDMTHTVMIRPAAGAMKGEYWRR